MAIITIYYPSFTHECLMIQDDQPIQWPPSESWLPTMDIPVLEMLVKAMQGIINHYWINDTKSTLCAVSSGLSLGILLAKCDE